MVLDQGASLKLFLPYFDATGLILFTGKISCGRESVGTVLQNIRSTKGFFTIFGENSGFDKYRGTGGEEKTLFPTNFWEKKSFWGKKGEIFLRPPEFIWARYMSTPIWGGRNNEATFYGDDVPLTRGTKEGGFHTWRTT